MGTALAVVELLGLNLWSVGLCLFSLEWEWLRLDLLSNRSLPEEECSRAALSSLPAWLCGLAFQSIPHTHTNSEAQIHNHCFLKDRKWGRLPVTVLFHVVTSWCLALAVDFLHCSCNRGFKSCVCENNSLSMQQQFMRQLLTHLSGFARLWTSRNYQGI